MKCIFFIKVMWYICTSLLLTFYFTLFLSLSQQYLYVSVSFFRYIEKNKGPLTQNTSLQLKNARQSLGMFFLKVQRRTQRSQDTLLRCDAIMEITVPPSPCWRQIKQLHCQLATLNKSLQCLLCLWGLLTGPLFWNLN